MPRVQIHCYGCDATVPVATSKSAEALDRAGWSLAHGETYCPGCLRGSRGLDRPPRMGIPLNDACPG